MRGPVHYIPILTTVVALLFATELFRRYRKRGGLHLLWWGIGMLTYAGGTAAEAYVTVFGWDLTVFRLWYVFGALLGGAPLAQGSVYLHLSRRHLHAAPMPLEQLHVVPPPVLPRSRLLRKPPQS